MHRHEQQQQPTKAKMQNAKAKKQQQQQQHRMCKKKSFLINFFQVSGAIFWPCFI